MVFGECTTALYIHNRTMHVPTATWQKDTEMEGIVSVKQLVVQMPLTTTQCVIYVN